MGCQIHTVAEWLSGVAEHQVPFWLRFSAHWFSPTRFQYHEAGTADDWQAMSEGCFDWTL